MQADLKSREHDKFRDATSGKTKVAVTQEGDSGLLEGISYDDIQAVFPSDTITNYNYYKDSVLQATVEVTFTDSAHNEVLRVRKI